MKEGDQLYGYCVQSLSHIQLPMNCNMPSSLVVHYFPEFAQGHVHYVNDAIKPSHPLSPPSPPALNLSRNQGLFQ